MIIHNYHIRMNRIEISTTKFEIKEDKKKTKQKQSTSECAGKFLQQISGELKTLSIIHVVVRCKRVVRRTVKFPYVSYVTWIQFFLYFVFRREEIRRWSEGKNAILCTDLNSLSFYRYTLTHTLFRNSL